MLHVSCTKGSDTAEPYLFFPLRSPSPLRYLRVLFYLLQTENATGRTRWALPVGRQGSITGQSLRFPFPRELLLREGLALAREEPPPELCRTSGAEEPPLVRDEE